MALKKSHVLTILGTRPEIIKLAPVLKQLEAEPALFKSTLVLTGQHRQMADQMLRQFNLFPQVDLQLMKPGQRLEELTATALLKLAKVFQQQKPEIILVQGDTTSAMAGALAGFYHKIPVAHVEAGLRTYNHYHPYPEEVNRRIISSIADWHFAPTRSAKEHLIKEGIDPRQILVSGNTVIDALKMVVQPNFDIRPWLADDEQLVLVTMHRRENYGQEFIDILEAVKKVLVKKQNIKVIFPVHPNPMVREAINKVFKRIPDNLSLLSPLDYPVFVNLLARAHLVITDSGGLQEEATAFGTPTIVCRKVTERAEALGGRVYLIPPHATKIEQQALKLLSMKVERFFWQSPFGDGNASDRITTMLSWIAGRTKQRPRPFVFKKKR